MGGLTGTLSGSIDDQTKTGTLNLKATGTATTNATLFDVALSDGSTSKTFLAGIPGSWQGLLTGLTNKEGSISFITGNLSDLNYTGSGDLSASGSITRDTGYSSSGIFSSLDIPVPAFASVNMGSSFSVMVLPGSSGYVKGYETSTGGVAGIWGFYTSGGSYSNTGGVGTWYANYGAFCPSTPYAFLGDITLTDDLAGHTSITGNDSIYYMDDRYFGLFSLQHRGVYTYNEVTYGYDYESVASGTYKLAPLKYHGTWSPPTTLYYNADGYMYSAGTDSALIGGIQQAPWTGTTDFKAIGQYSYSPGYGGYAYYLWNTPINGYDPGYSSTGYGGYFKGATAGIWGSSKPGSIRAIYIAPQVDSVSTAGILTSDNIAVSLYSNLGMFMAEGNLSPYSGLTHSGNPADLTIYSPSSQSMILSGSFVDTSGSPISGSSVSGSGYFATQYLVQSWTTSPPWGIYNFVLSGYNAFSGKPTTGDAKWSAELGGEGNFGYGGYGGPVGYWLAQVAYSGSNWTQDGQITGTVSGDYVTPNYMGTLAGPFFGVNTGIDYGGWIGQSIGIYQGTSTDFGGNEWYHSSLYNSDGYVEWDDGGEGAFGFKKRTDGNYDFLAIGEFYDYGSGAEGIGGPYVWSGSMYNRPDMYRQLEAFSAGIWKKADPENTTGTMDGYAAAVYYVEDLGKVGLIAGNITGTFYDMAMDDGVYGLWKVASGTSGLTHTDKTASLPDDFSFTTAEIEYNSLYAYAAGKFAGSTENTIFGEYYNGKTKFITYVSLDDNETTKSLPFGIYNLKLGEGSEYNYYSGKPAGASVSWSAKIGADGYFGYNESTDYGYWIAGIDGGKWDEYSSNAGHGTISGNLSGKYLTLTHMGDIAGPFFGLYNADWCEGPCSSDGTWIGVSVGTYQGTPLTFGGYWNEHYYENLDSLYYNESGYMTWAGEEWGVVGITDTLWDNGTKNFLAMGQFDIYESGYPRYLWNSPISAAGVLDKAYDNMPLSGGDFLGYTTGIWRNREDNRTLSGAAAALYVAPDGTSAGLLRSYVIDSATYTVSSSPALTLTGENYPDIGMWELSGKMNTIEKETGDLSESLSVRLMLYEVAMAAEFADVGSISGYAYSKAIYFNDGSQSFPWGVYNQAMHEEGIFNLSGTNTVTAFKNKPIKVGGIGFGGYSYWIGDLKTEWTDDPVDGTGYITGGEIQGSIAGTYLSLTQKGKFAGPFAGIYDYDYDGSYDPQNGTWIGSSVGTYEGTTLTFSGETYGSLMYYNGATALSTGGSASGLLGGTAATLFSGTNTSVLMMGDYSACPISEPYLMYGSGWYFNGTSVSGSSESGAFDGYLVGLWRNKTIKAKMLSLYYTPLTEGEKTAGYLESVGTGAFNLSGSYYPDIGMWEIPDGTLKAIPSEDTITTSEIAGNYFEGSQGLGTFNTTGGGTLSVAVSAGDPLRFSELNWGIWNAGFGGTYSGTTYSNWTVRLGGDFRTGYSDSTENGYWLGTITGTTWGDPEIGGTYSGDALTNLARYYDINGDIIGSHKLVDEEGQWQAAGIGKYKKEDLVLNGTWNNNTYTPVTPPGDLYSLYANDVGNGLHVGEDWGIIGVTEGNTIYGMGRFRDYWYDGGSGGGPYLWNSPIAGATVPGKGISLSFGGFSAGIWKDNLMKGSAIAIFSSNNMAGFLYTPLTSTDEPFGLTGSYFNTFVYNGEGDSYNDGMWKFQGILASISMPVPEGFDVADYEIPDSAGYIQNAKFSGRFDGQSGSAISGSGSGELTFLRNTASPYTTLPWGVYNLRLYGEGNVFSGKPSGTATWSATAGGEIGYDGYGGYGGFSGYWLATVKGKWTADGEITGNAGAISGVPDTFGRYITQYETGTMSGPFYGINNGASSTWIGQSIGTYQKTTDLLFSNRIEGDLYKQNTATYHDTRYEKPVYREDSYSPMGTAEYETGYIKSGNAVKYGLQSEEKRNYDSISRTYVTAYPSDTYIAYFNDNNVPMMSMTSRGSVFLSPWPDLSTSPPTTPFGVSPDTVLTNDWPVTSPGISVATDEYAKTFEAEYTGMNVMERVLSDTPNLFDQTFNGIMGGYQLTDGVDSLWATDATHPVGVTFLGTHEDTTLPAVFRLRRFYSQNYAVTGNSPAPTPDGGAYIGFLSGTVSSDRSLNAALYGLYMSPTVSGTWEAGFLVPSSILTGTSYAGINMWDADGTIYRMPLISLTESYFTSRDIPVVDAANLLDLTGSSWTNLVIGGMGYPGKKMELYGQFNSGATLSGEIKTLVSMGYGTTLSINGLPCNGIFELLHGGLNNTYSNPSGYTSLQIDMASMGQFGGSGTYVDFGLWTASIDGTVTSPNKLSGTLGGEFLTYTKQGSLTGTFLGNLIPATSTTGSWEGATVGYWQRERFVDFSSGITGQTYYLRKSYSGGSSGISSYWASENFDGSDLSASSYTNISGSPITYTRYNWSGPPDQKLYTKTVWNMTDSSIYTLVEAKTLTETDYNSEIDTLISTQMPNQGYQINYDSGHDGVFAGFNDESGHDLWYHMANGLSTELALMGQYSDMENKPSLFGSTIASFNPYVNMDPYINSESPIGGAYYGYLGAAFGKKIVDADWLDGMINGIYYDPTGKVGVYYGSFSGNNNPNIGAWSTTGTIDGGYQLVTGYGGLSATNFVSNLVFENWDSSFSDSDGVVEGATIKLRTEKINVAYVQDCYLSPSGFWSVWQSVAGGTYSGTPTAWQWEYDKNTSHGLETTYQAFQTTGTANGITTGTTVGASVSYNNPSTSVHGGMIKGLFDPSTTPYKTWQAVTQGVTMETNTFLAQAAAISGNAAAQQAFMNATKIPVVQVGQATLSQTPMTTVNNLSNVVMNNVTFFSNATGGVPSIWATNGVSGSYSGSPSTSGLPLNNVPLSGNGLNATFNVNYWVGTNWGAKVAGSGNLSGGSYTGSVQFTGGAAGKIDQPSAGSFSGTGAGIAKQ